MSKEFAVFNLLDILNKAKIGNTYSYGEATDCHQLPNFYVGYGLPPLYSDIDSITKCTLEESNIWNIPGRYDIIYKIKLKSNNFIYLLNDSINDTYVLQIILKGSIISVKKHIESKGNFPRGFIDRMIPKITNLYSNSKPQIGHWIDKECLIFSDEGKEMLINCPISVSNDTSTIELIKVEKLLQAIANEIIHLGWIVFCRSLNNAKNNAKKDELSALNLKTLIISNSEIKEESIVKEVYSKGYSERKFEYNSFPSNVFCYEYTCLKSVDQNPNIETEILVYYVIHTPINRKKILCRINRQENVKELVSANNNDPYTLEQCLPIFMKAMKNAWVGDDKKLNAYIIGENDIIVSLDIDSSTNEERYLILQFISAAREIKKELEKYKQHMSFISKNKNNFIAKNIGLNIGVKEIADIVFG